MLGGWRRKGRRPRMRHQTVAAGSWFDSISIVTSAIICEEHQKYSRGTRMSTIITGPKDFRHLHWDVGPQNKIDADGSRTAN